MKRPGWGLLLAIVLVGTACSTSEPAVTPASTTAPAAPTTSADLTEGADLPGDTAPIAIVTDTGAIAIVRQPGAEPTIVSPQPTSDAAYTQPSWSPDGRKLAFVEVLGTTGGGGLAAGDFIRTSFQAQGALASVVVYDLAATTSRTLAVPFIPFYLYWSPDGGTISLLGNSPPRIGFGILDVDTGAFREVDNDQPYFYAWAPDSTRVVAHAFTDLYFVDKAGTQVPIELSAGGFSAPQWEGDRIMLTIEEDGAQAIVLINREGQVMERLVEIESVAAADLHPDGARVAFIDIPPGSSSIDLGKLQIAGPEGIIDVADSAAAFFWSPAGDRLLYLAVSEEGERIAVRWNIWEEGRTITFDPFIPSPELFTQYLPFFSQYSNSHTFFSPAGDAFVYAGEDLEQGAGVWLQEIADGVSPRRLAAGNFGAWAPAGG